MSLSFSSWGESYWKEINASPLTISIYSVNIILYLLLYVCSPHVITIIICACVLQFFWALGAMMEAALALVVMTKIDDDVNWRWLLGLSAIPIGLMSFVFPVSICCVK